MEWKRTQRNSNVTQTKTITYVEGIDSDEGRLGRKGGREGGKGTTSIRKECARGMGKEAKVEEVDFLSVR